MKNPFLAGRPVTGAGLVGRDKIIEKILSLVTNGNSVVLIGPRRIGKTSILLEVLERLKRKKFYTANVDFFSAPSRRHLAEQITENVLKNKKLDHLFNKFKGNLSSLLKQVQLRPILKDFEFILSFTDYRSDEYELLKESLQFIDRFAARNEKKIVCGFDEFGDLEKLNGDGIIKMFRSIIQLQENSSYIFSGSFHTVMHKLFVTSRSPFYRFAEIINVGAVNNEEFIPYLEKSFGELGLIVPLNSIEQLLEFTGGHPYYTQLAAREISFQYRRGDTVTPDQISMLIDSLAGIEINYLEKLWEEIKKNRQFVPVVTKLAEEARGVYGSLDTTRINVGRVINNLISMNVIEKAGKGYRFIDPLFRYYLRTRILKMKDEGRGRN